ncbi:MAG: S8 family peptidase [Planctomycetota bacterium]|jgi:subtilisin
MNLRVFILTLSVLVLPSLAFSREKLVVIGFKQKPSPSESEKVLVHRAKAKIRRTYKLIPAVAASLPEEEIDKLRKNSKIAYVEEDAVYTAAVDSGTFEELDNSWGVRHIFADVAHANGNRGMGVKVAVIDTGIDYTHEDLNGNYRGGYDFVFNDDDPFDDSFDSHGTYVAGIIAAEDDGAGIVGVAPEVDLYALKVLDGAGFGTVEWIIAGIDWAVQNGIDIVNLSIEGPHRQALQDACDEAYNAGVLLVAAGGNSLVDGGAAMYPAAYDSVIAVTATDSSDVPGLFSPIDEQMELAAPGVGILSTVAGGSYDSESGTSTAAAHVTGTAALYVLANTEDLSGDGLVNNEDVRLMLQLTATDLGEAGKDNIYGYGLVNAAGTLTSSEAPLTVTRTSGWPTSDAEVAEIEGRPYGIVIANSGLSDLTVDVFEGEVLRKDLSGVFQFRGGRPQEVVFWLDATGAHYYVCFTPYGAPERFAEIVLTTDIKRILKTATDTQ